jgi:hypothetical protein
MERFDWMRIEENCPDFISKDEHSCDLSANDYSIRSILEAKACSKPHQSTESVKKVLLKGTFWKPGMNCL